MRIRAGIVLIQENKVALIERHRAGLDYFVFPGGGVDEGESPEQAAVREEMEEVQLGRRSRQVYFLAEQVGGEFGTGTGEEFTDSDPDHPQQGIYIPIWMPIDELPQHTNIYPADVARLVVKSMREGWLQDSTLTFDEPE